jgi:hypothetical protein
MPAVTPCFGFHRTSFAAPQAKGDLGALAETACNLDHAARLVGEAVHLREVKASALTDGLGGKERIKHLGNHILRDTGAGIGDGNAHVLVTAFAFVHQSVFCGDRDLAAGGHCVSGIERQIDEGCFKLRGTGVHGPDTVRDIHGALNGAAKPGLEHFPDSRHGLSYIDEKPDGPVGAAQS